MTDQPQVYNPYVNPTFGRFTPEQEASLYRKVAEVTGRLRNIKKDKRHTQGWEYASWESIATAINHQLGEAKLAFMPEVVGPVLQEPVGKTNGGATIFRYTVTMRMTLADGDTGAFVSLMWVSISDDSTDKGLEKAYTFAIKGFLKKVFVIGVGDDPDGESTDEDLDIKEPQQKSPPPPPPPALVERHPKASRPEENQPKPDDRLANLKARVTQLCAQLAVDLKTNKFDENSILKRMGVEDTENADQIERAIPAIERNFAFQRAIAELKPADSTHLTNADWSKQIAAKMKDLNLHWDPAGNAEDDALILATLRNDLFPPVLPEAADEEDFSIAALEGIVGKDEDDEPTPATEQEPAEEEADSEVEGLGGFDAF